MRLIQQIKQSRNEYLQGGIFLLNLMLRDVRHRQNAKTILRKGVSVDLTWNFEKYKKSDTLFILGSGGSIADYSKEHFDLIREHDSVGFNFWVLHEFIPTFLTVEFTEHSSRADSLWKNLSLRSEDYADTPVIFKYSPVLAHSCALIPPKLNNKYLATSLSIPGLTREMFLRWLTFLQKNSWFTPKRKSNSILYRQASLSWLITFGLYLGYKNIVLCGVDLNSPDYFYDRDTRYVECKKLEIPDSGFTGDRHPTESAELYAFEMPVSEILSIIKNVVLDPQNVSLWIGSKSSALYPDIPLYNW